MSITKRTMDAQHIGLSSLTKRILELEEQLKNMQDPEATHTTDIVEQQRKKRNERTRLELDKCFTHYHKGLSKHLTPMVGTTSDNLLLVLQYSVI